MEQRYEPRTDKKWWEKMGNEEGYNSASPAEKEEFDRKTVQAAYPVLRAGNEMPLDVKKSFLKKALEAAARLGAMGKAV